MDYTSTLDLLKSLRDYYGEISFNEISNNFGSAVEAIECLMNEVEELKTKLKGNSDEQVQDKAEDPV